MILNYTQEKVPQKERYPIPAITVIDLMLNKILQLLFLPLHSIQRLGLQNERIHVKTNFVYQYKQYVSNLVSLECNPLSADRDLFLSRSPRSLSRSPRSRSLSLSPPRSLSTRSLSRLRSLLRKSPPTGPASVGLLTIPGPGRRGSMSLLT